jgi:hypothetical protein
MCGAFSPMPEVELFLLFVRPLQHAGKHSMIAVSGKQLDRPMMQGWIQRRGLQAEWPSLSK